MRFLVIVSIEKMQRDDAVFKLKLCEIIIISVNISLNLTESEGFIAFYKWLIISERNAILFLLINSNYI